MRIEKMKTSSTPYILIDEERRYMCFQGESFHENVLECYGEVIDWLQSFLAGGATDMVFDCELKYFNSSTAKMLLNILLMLDEACARGTQMVVNWITTSDNEINLECGEDFADEVQHLEFNIVVHA